MATAGLTTGRATVPGDAERTPHEPLRGVEIWKRRRCRACGWGVVFAICAEGMGTTAPYSEWDWWVYCGNKTCEHHGGEGQFQVDPDWVETVNA